MLWPLTYIEDKKPVTRKGLRLKATAMILAVKALQSTTVAAIMSISRADMLAIDWLSSISSRTSQVYLPQPQLNIAVEQPRCRCIACMSTKWPPIPYV